MKYDQEDLILKLGTIMTGGLNTKIAAIEAEKTTAGYGLTPTLAAIPSGSYYVQTWSDKILNSNPAIFYGIEDVQSSENGYSLAKTYKLFVEIVLIDNGMTNDTWKRISRYSRALEELFQEASYQGVLGSQVKIDSVRPVSFKLEADSSEEIRVGGISLAVTLV